MDKDLITRRSKFLSLVLRHEPARAGVALDETGWCDVDALLDGCARAGHPMGRAELEEVVHGNDKRRFALSEDGARIRACQGHSVEVELGYEAATPPPVLYHGTADRNLDSIRRQGLVKGSRHHVHLSPDPETARKVGMRHGRPAILEIETAAMVSAGHSFFVSTNGIWMTDSVPPEFLRFPGNAGLGER